MPFIPRTSNRACKELTMARIVACLNSPQGVDINSKHKNVPSPKLNSRLRPRRATCTTILNSPANKLSELYLSSPRRTPKPLSRVTGLNKKKDVTLNTNPQYSIDSEDSFDESNSSTSESSFSASDSSISSDSNGHQYRTKGLLRKTKVDLCSNRVNSMSTHRKRALSQMSRDISFLNLSPMNSEYGWLPGREQEFENIYTFIFNKLSQRSGGCMYISGIPGTGKTASVQAVLSTMHKLVADSCLESQLPVFQTIYVNGMRVSDPKQIYIQIYEQLTGLIATTKSACDLLEKEFCSSTNKKLNHREVSEKPVILVIDELDLLCTRRQDILYSLFDWPTRHNNRRVLIVLAIANTMDLPERLLHPRVASRLGLTRLTFAPYSHEQLSQIVRHRLSSLSNILQPKALELAARKVAAVSGDVRRALDICKRAAEIVSSSEKTNKEIDISHINAALKEMFVTPKSDAICACSLYEKLFLRAVIAEFQARSTEEARLDRCIRQMSALCRLEGVPCPTTSEVFAICASLGAHKLLLTERSRYDIAMLVRLNCTKSDILYCLNSQSNG
ncbi:Origin recognition complex subunit 1 [Schistosoma japonicum]|uniref:Origin recognition complex subunit 1 n=1 Tax=Schistosoma japonicum TaxID=6182 RepID=C1LH62_SCHJA|nr:Origin recognition complex subunit 1 [Schistosoma japonicum]KAH8868226.1 Origin recognition complex subunit 1 [Schistosoma japonicum]KAH8868227.1 Origin recognition complex subunit 1 [Schistosoma japonicum]CAX74040.1 origin recognition complex protein 1 [Schistosoma japonicum]